MFSTSNKTQIVLLQLPHPSYAEQNIPLAAGYLKASAFTHGLLKEVDIQILPPPISDYSGCNRLVDYLINMHPDILGCTLYLWNVERTLYILDQVKQKLPQVKIIVGGPEVVADSPIINLSRQIDFAVIGEGEITFVELIKHILHEQPPITEIHGICYRKNDKIFVNSPRRRITDIESIPSPYLLDFIDLKNYSKMLLFTMRGCLLGCSYCSWAGRGKLRPYSINRLRNELLLAQKSGVKRVAIMDSAFNSSPILVEFCQMVQEINQDRSLKFNAFIRADMVDVDTARWLKAANFTDVEVGLQSTNPNALAYVNRPFDIGKFQSGVKILAQEGIRVDIDVILGLPGDSPKQFDETITFVKEIGKQPVMSPLSLSYGTKLRRHSESFGAKIQDAPPYYILETDTFRHQDLKTAFCDHALYSSDLDMILNIRYPSILLDSKNNLNHRTHFKGINYPISNIVLKMNKPLERSAHVYELADVISSNVASNVSLMWIGNRENLHRTIWLFEVLLKTISLRNPYITWDIHLDTGGDNLSQSTLDEILSFIYRKESFLDRREDIFPKKQKFICRKSSNIFVHVPCKQEIGLLQVNEANCVRTLTIDGKETAETNIQKIKKYLGAGILVDFSDDSTMDCINKFMGDLVPFWESGTQIFFKDRMLQRIWEQDVLEKKTRLDIHYEWLIDQEMNIFDKLVNENELPWDSIIKWNMLEYYGFNAEEYISSQLKQIAP
jgi:hypothetical protein